jgi:hypothetical protein
MVDMTIVAEPRVKDKAVIAQPPPRDKAREEK